jgi:hypothetical protein
MAMQQPGTITKSALMRALEQLPEDASQEEVLDCILFVLGVERAMERIEAGETITHEEALNRINKWLN